MKINIGAQILLENCTPGDLIDIKNGLTLLNPKFDLATRMNLSLWGVPEKLKYYKQDGDTLTVPVGILDTLLQKYPTAAVSDYRFLASQPTGVKFTGTLRDYQVEALEATEHVRHANVGFICPVGQAGKVGSYATLGARDTGV